MNLEMIEDIKNKMKIARNVCTVCNTTNRNVGPEKLFQIYTGYEANPALITPKCSFTKFANFKSQSPKNTEELRKQLFEWYIKEGKPPTIRDIATFAGISDTDLQEYFYQMAQIGFVWKNIPNTPKALFVEKYEMIAKRLRYLIKIREYRQMKQHIIYLEDCTHRPNVKCKSYIAVSNRRGLLSIVRKAGRSPVDARSDLKKYDWEEHGLRFDEAQGAAVLAPTVPSTSKKALLSSRPIDLSWSVIEVPEYPEIIQETAAAHRNHLEWVKDHIINVIDEPCVFVYEGYPFTQHDLFGPLSSKQDMKEYLDKNGVPYSRNAHRMELHDQVKRFTKPKLDLLSDLINTHGHDVLEVPYGLNSLLFFEEYWPLVADEKFKLTKMKEAEAKIVAAEETMFTADRVMEQVVDKLLTLGKYEREAMPDLTDYIDVLKYDSECGYQTMFVD